ncbi:MAG: hypothetical protein EOO10_16690 [Chitinophagaceae bacterium]|nr:MAG: hypothetical protein EOO10_16690 [Chitinophagaceae bacterium]
MPVITEHYDQLKIDKLKHYLEMQAGKGQPVPFELFVDNLKVVPRTEDPKEFDNYEFYMNEDTEKVRILIYSYGQSPRNDQYCYMVQKNKLDKGLNGLGEIENIVQEKLAARDREHEMNRLREELEATKLELEESEEYNEKLEKEIEFLKENKFKLKNIDIGELASVAIEGIVRRNPQFLTRLPGGEALAGVIVLDNKEKERMLAQSPVQESQVTVEKETEPQITEEEKRHLVYLRKLEQTFNREQAEMFNAVINAMVEEPSIIPTLLEFINPKQ